MNMKKILSSLLLLASLSFTQADTLSTALTGGTNATILTLGPGKILSISVRSSAGTNGLINFYDSPYNTNTYIVGAYTNVSKSVGTTNIVYTNIFGALNTNSYTVIRYTTNTLAAGARLRQLLFSFTTVSNTLETREFAGGVPFGQGILATNISQLGGAPGNVTIDIEYEKYR
jgi:hypothetical protein